MVFDWQTITPALLGFAGGIVGSLFAPWVHWSIEKRKLRLQSRKEKIARWREELSDHDTFASFAETATFQDLRHRFTKEEIKSFYNTWLDLNPKISGEASKFLRFHEVVSKIEREWGIT